jgi:hypothetical protein
MGNPRPGPLREREREREEDSSQAPFRRKRNMNHEIANVIASSTIASEEP